jgi:putative pyruvate formate lyase activating enzyme
VESTLALKTSPPLQEPGSLILFDTGELERRAEALEEKLQACDLCPNRCGVDRTAGEVGLCGTDARTKIASANIHPWEEPPISGTGGSGTIFFSGCTLRCVFCQNYPISQLGVGRNLTVEELADAMLHLQQRGAHNVNLVTSTHQMPAVVRALTLAVPRGFHLPLVYNSSGYESPETLELLDGVVDVYLPDIKYDDPAAAKWCSGTPGYVETDRAALEEMWRRVGPLKIDPDGIARRGMMVRHLVLPGDLSGTRECMRFLAETFGPEVWVSLMHQYFPAHRAHDRPPLDRKVTEEEYRAALEVLDEFGLENGFVQEVGCEYCIDCGECSKRSNRVELDSGV